MEVFLTGATGYIGGSIGVSLIRAGHEVSGLVRTAEGGHAIAELGMKPVEGTLDSTDILREAACAADAVIHTAHADHLPSVRAIVDALAGSGKRLIHTSGSSIVGTAACGKRLDPVYDEDTDFTPSPGRAARVALNRDVLAGASRGLHPVIIAPSLIYGRGHGVHRHSMQIPWLIETARKHEGARHLGPGENIWANVHIDDLVDLYLLALTNAPAGAFYWAENGANSMRELCEAINRTMGIERPAQAMTPEEASAEWGEGPALNTMGSNSRVVAARARRELGWIPSRPSAIEEIEHGCYRRGKLD